MLTLHTDPANELKMSGFSVSVVESLSVFINSFGKWYPGRLCRGQTVPFPWSVFGWISMASWDNILTAISSFWSWPLGAQKGRRGVNQRREEASVVNWASVPLEGSQRPSGVALELSSPDSTYSHYFPRWLRIAPRKLTAQDMVQAEYISLAKESFQVQSCWYWQ